ncbi:GlsB/YeaQ/YmgE family stress response membrane protein [Aurantiacibacter aquimixticola]|uniref:GlsB/YeaQ/YmgE family stress response membrane protein n=1 Tax=Aurantiacibacter aquimixticola TaxID=1958945 RepID=A0A419RUG5_9SPHN|nr:GlsB/YeaQ/YmgE family stress response membrane protein [Aurantiacibacter aquimixticola]RJY09426.1 GlsB/YeaQ/YmgE family stress response membrane protein [Aurantiacibacter aquimixticola]
MGIVFMIVVGGILGWLTAFLQCREGDMGCMQQHLASGVAGALLGGLLFAPAIGAGDLVSARYSVGALFVSVFGALIALFFLNLLQRRILR